MASYRGGKTPVKIDLSAKLCRYAVYAPPRWNLLFMYLRIRCLSFISVHVYNRPCSSTLLHLAHFYSHFSHHPLSTLYLNKSIPIPQQHLFLNPRTDTLKAWQHFEGTPLSDAPPSSLENPLYQWIFSFLTLHNLPSDSNILIPRTFGNHCSYDAYILRAFCVN